MAETVSKPGIPELLSQHFKLVYDEIVKVSYQIYRRMVVRRESISYIMFVTVLSHLNNTT